MIIAGTGHRPNKLGGYEDFYYNKLCSVAELFLEKNKTKITEVISGGALGWDMALAIAAIRLRIKLTIASPFMGQEKAWPKIGVWSQATFFMLKEKAHNYITVCDGDYAAWKMQKRNEWMVDRCDLLLALWDGSKGGTYNCIEYAKQKNKRIMNLWGVYEQKRK